MDFQYPDGCIPFQFNKEELLPLEKKIVQGMILLEYSSILYLFKGVVPAIQALHPDQVQIALIRAILLLDESTKKTKNHIF